jgi:hypothetical protein
MQRQSLHPLALDLRLDHRALLATAQRRGLRRLWGAREKNRTGTVFFALRGDCRVLIGCVWL